MKITEKYSVDGWDRASYELNVYNDTGKYVGGFDISDNLSECPEDVMLCRDLSFALDVVDLMKLAWEAGKRGEPLKIEDIEEECEDGR